MTKQTKIILAGGKTGGPITPLIALAQSWQEKERSIYPIVVDLKNSAGERLARNNNYDFHSIVSGKFRRYWWAWQNLFFPFLLVIGFVQSFVLLIRMRPSLVIGAGGFVQVPLMLSAWLLKIPRAVHQQDVLVSLSNKICAPLANVITTTFKESQKSFSQGSGFGREYLKHNKIYWTGNPVRPTFFKLPNQTTARKKFGLDNKLPVLLVFGGGSGSMAINNLITQNLAKLTKVVQVIHSTGTDRKSLASKNKNYASYDFIEDMPAAYSAADLVLARAGIGSLTELAAVQKPGLIVPMPNTHQELNAELIFISRAGIVLDQNELDGDHLIANIRKVLFDDKMQKSLTKNMAQLFTNNANKNMIKVLEKVLHHG